MQHVGIWDLIALSSVCCGYGRINAKLRIKIALTPSTLGHCTEAKQSYNEPNISGLRENILIHKEAVRKLS